jgi:hypothetical protein
MKKILMAAVAVSALSVGVANAATISNTSTVAGVSLAPAGATITVNPYTVASEIVTTSTTAATSVLTISPTTATTISAGNYIVTYNITGGTFTTTGVTTASLAVNGLNVVSSVNTVSATSISFNVTVGAGLYLTSASLTNAVKLGVAKSDVSISGIITTADGANVDGGAIAAKKIIDYRSAFLFDGTAADATLTIASGFEAFAVGGASTNIGTAIGFATNDGVDANDIVYIDATGTAAATSDLTAAVLTLTGDVSAFDADANGTAPDADTTNVFTLGAGDLADLQGQVLTVGLSQQATAVAGNASDYSLGVEVEMGAGYTAPTFASIPLGSVALEGTNFYAAWVGDGTNGINYSIRLGNRSAAPVTGVSVALLNSLNATTVTTCAIGTIPASGELLITSASLNACFGNYGRADLRITVQASNSAVTAKMRSVSAGVVNEQSLGGGTTTASAN